MTLTDSPVFAVCMMLAGLAAATVWYAIRLRKENLPVRAALLTAVFGSLLAFICAKMGYLIHDLCINLFEGNFEEVTALEASTFSFVGGAAGFAAGTVIAAHMTGILPLKAMDVFAAPGCIFICLARIAEGGMDTLGMGAEVTAEWMRFFPLAVKDSWGDAYLCVFVLEALWALVCLIPALGKNGGYGYVFRRTAVWLLGAQIGFEMLLMYPYIRSFYRSFVSLEQVLCAVFLVVIVARGCARKRNWLPLVLTVVLFGLSTFFQFYRDNKFGFVFEEGWEWALENKDAIAFAAFFLISAGLIAAGKCAIRAQNDKI